MLKRNYALLLPCLSFLLTSCIEEVIIAPWGKENTFHIKKGEQYSDPRKPAWPLSFEDGLEFSAILEPNTEYDVGKENQVNKLLGFSDCNDSHMENSARFGWIFIQGEMRIVPFVHRNGQMDWDVANPIGVVQLGKEYSYKIEISGESYIFSFKNDFGQWVTQTKARGCKGHSSISLDYLNQPYFGGKYKAPHDMTIRINLP